MSCLPLSAMRLAASTSILAQTAFSTIAPLAAQSLPRAKIVLPNVQNMDVAAQTVTLPLQRGRAGDKTVWYIVTDSSDKTDAQKRGAIYAPLLANVGTGCTACVETVQERNGDIRFAGTPISHRRVRSCRTDRLSAEQRRAGRDRNFVAFAVHRIGASKTVINAPIVATGDCSFDVRAHKNTHERVIAIDTEKRTVTLLLVHGFANGKPVLYISTEASDSGVAAIERAALVPSLAKASAEKIQFSSLRADRRPAR